MPAPRRDRTRTRAALLAVARMRFARDGFDATSVRDIAEDAGVDAALVFRYFGSKQGLFEEAAIAGDHGAAMASGAVEHLPAMLFDSIVFQDWSQYAGEHPLIAMLRSSGHDSVRERMRTEVCTTYVDRLSTSIVGADPGLRAELLSAWILGIAVLRSVVGTPALHAATPADLAPYFDQIATLLMGRPIQAQTPAGKGKKAAAKRRVAT